MEEEENIRTPFWQQTALPDTFRRSQDGRRSLRRTSSIILNSSLALVVFLVVVFCVVFIIVPSFLSFVSQIFRPRLVKKSWDSLNLVLVLFAILCGFLGRNYSENRGVYEDRRSVSDVSDPSQKSNSSTPRQWKGNLDRAARNGDFSRLRSSSSYSDLARQSSWGTSGADERWRFSDDTFVANYQYSGSDPLLPRHHRPELGEADLDLEEKRTPSKNTSVVDREAVPPRSSPPPPFLPPQSSHPPPFLPLQSSPPSSPPSNPTSQPPYTIQGAKVEKRKVKRRHGAPGNDGKTRDRKETVSSEVKNLQPLEQSRSEVKNLRPPEHSEQRSDKNEKKRGGATKDFLTTLKRKKKQRQKSTENLDAFFSPQSSSSTPLSPSSASSLQSQSSSSVFQAMFSSKKGKSKKSHSVPNRLPPEITPAFKASKSEAQSLPLNSHKLQFPSNKINEMDEHANSGNESPLFQIPKPPPLPPFKMAEWKFQVQGDFVRIKSTKTSPGTSELEESEDSPTTGESPSFKAAGNDGSLFFPSPDVNSKADSFIAMFRAGLQLEKINSFKQKQGRRRSNLGRERNPDTEQ